MKTNNVILTSMKKSMKYICLFLMLLGIHVNAWGTTTTEVIFPAGTTSSYSSGDWGEHGAYIGEYPTTEMTESMCISDGVGFDVKFYYAYDGGNSDGLQLKKNSSAYVEMTIASSNGITVEVTYSTTSDFDIDLTGAKTITASSANTTASINTNNTNATLKINGTSNVVYIKYIKITRKSTGTITIGHDDCTVGANITFGATSVSKTVTPAEAESGGTFSTLRVDGVNIYDGEEYDCENWVSYAFDYENASGASGTYGTDWEFSVEAASSGDAWTCIDYGVGAFTNEALTISYTFLSEPEPGTYTVDLIARTWDAEWNAYDFTIPVTLTVADPCTSRSITMSNFSKDFGSEDFVPTHTVSAGEGTKTWTSSNTDVATIVAGKVHIVASGTTTIGLTVAEDDPYCEVSQSCTMTVNALVPTVTAFTGTSTSTTSITLTNAQVSNKGGASISAYGYIYSTTASTTETLKLGETGVSTATVASADIAASTNFASKTVSGLTTGTTYYVRAYATNSAGTGYSAVQSVKTIEYTDYTFSCAELTLTPKLITASTPIFITSAASKKVRSQDSILIVGSGLTPSTSLTFPSLADSKFSVKSRKGGDFTTKADGTIDTVAYIFYTPDAEDTSDGLDKLTGFTASVGGAKPITVSLTQDIYGRHLPSQFVIAGKKDNKWYALPATMATGSTPVPSEIAVNDFDNPSIAYVVDTTIYGFEGPSASNLSGGNGQYVRLTMSKLTDGTGSAGPAPLYASTTANIGKNGTAGATSDLSAGWWWALTQKNTSITNPQDAKYNIKSPNNSNTLSIKNDPFVWGSYASGVEELRLIPASDIIPTEAYFVEWSQHGGVVEVDATGIDATSVVAHLGGESSSAITLTQTKASDAKNKSSKYNYTVNFGNDIDFADAASNGAMLTLEWKNGETVKAMSNIVVPKIIASNATMSSINSGDLPWSQWEVHVLPGVTLTANAGDFASNDVTIKHLEIYPGATVTVTKGDAASGTLTANTLVLRNGWSRAGTKTYDVARLYVTPSTATLKATNVYADWYIDYDQYYPVAVPWNATVANFTYRYSSVDPTVGPTANIRLRYYDGNSRAINVQIGVGEGANWKAYGEGTNLAVPTTLTPSSGYVMTAKRPTGKAFSIIRMPLTLPSGTWGDGSWTTNGEAGEVSSTHKDQIAVTAHNSGSTPSYAQGWNLIANPYMSIYQGTIEYADKTKVQYVNIPDVDFKEYSQLPTATTKLAPSSAFLIQAPETGTITFGTAKRVASAPGFRRDVPAETLPTQEAYIVLASDEAEDMMGILVSDKYSAEYELNADLEKLMGDGKSLRTYMHWGEMNMAYLAINKELAQQWIPVSVRIEAEGEYTFSMHSASTVSELQGVYLTDYTTGQVTNLLEDSYSFYSTVGTIKGRFAINAIVGPRDVPTELDIVRDGNDGSGPIKFIYHDKVFILHQGVIYDSTGKKVREIKK